MFGATTPIPWGCCWAHKVPHLILSSSYRTPSFLSWTFSRRSKGRDGENEKRKALRVLARPNSPHPHPSFPSERLPHRLSKPIRCHSRHPGLALVVPLKFLLQTNMRNKLQQRQTRVYPGWQRFSYGLARHCGFAVTSHAKNSPLGPRLAIVNSRKENTKS